MSTIQELSLFAGVEASDVRRFLARARQSRFESNAPIFSPGEPHGFVWIVREGLVHVSTLSGQGRQLTMDLAGPGEVFDSLVDGKAEPHALTAQALVPSVVLRVPRADYEALLARSPAFARNVVQVLGTKLRDAQRMRGLTGEPAPRRVLQTLDWLHEKLGASIPVTRRVIGEIAGVSGETSIRVLSPLEKQGVIRTRRGSIRILDARRLSEKLLPKG